MKIHPLHLLLDTQKTQDLEAIVEEQVEIGVEDTVVKEAEIEVGIQETETETEIVIETETEIETEIVDTETGVTIEEIEISTIEGETTEKGTRAMVPIIEIAEVPLDEEDRRA